MVVEAPLIALALVVGSLLAVQAAANVQLTAAVGGPTSAAALQLGLAAALLTVVGAVSGDLGGLAKLTEVGAAWHLLGGIGSALYILAGIVLFRLYGAVVSVGLFITGQMLASLVLDGFGLLGLPRAPLSSGTLAGALAVGVGIAVIVTGQRRPAASPDATRPRRPLTSAGGVVLGLAAGAALPVQAAVNARLRADLDAPLAAALVSFLVATTAMAAVSGLAVLTGREKRPRLSGLARMPWWGWPGGAVGASYVCVTLLAAPVIGAAPTVALTVAGQQVASGVLDHGGRLRLPRRPVTPRRCWGVGLLVTGSALIQFT